MSHCGLFWQLKSDLSCDSYMGHSLTRSVIQAFLRLDQSRRDESDPEVDGPAHGGYCSTVEGTVSVVGRGRGIPVCEKSHGKSVVLTSAAGLERKEMPFLITWGNLVASMQRNSR